MPIGDMIQARGAEPIEGSEHYVLKSTLFLLPLSLFLLFLLPFNWEVAGPDVHAAVDPYLHRPVVYNDYHEPLNGETTGLDIRSTDEYTYTTYLPIVLSPELNPKKGAFMIYPPCSDISMLAASWYYNVSVHPDPICPTTDERFVPLVYNGENIEELLPIAITNAQASGWLMGFTEPNLSWQGNLTPTLAAELWHQIEDQAGSIKLVSPAPSQHDPDWLWDMVDEYQAHYGQLPRFDAIAWHIYWDDPQYIRDFLIARHEEASINGYPDVPIWVTEYSGKCWNSATADTGNDEIMTVVTPWFDSTPWIERYAWFANRIYGTEPSTPGWQSCSLVNVTTGALNPLGVIYAKY
jgi:hypothetical protein